MIWRPIPQLCSNGSKSRAYPIWDGWNVLLDLDLELLERVRKNQLATVYREGCWNCVRYFITVWWGAFSKLCYAATIYLFIIAIYASEMYHNDYSLQQQVWMLFDLILCASVKDETPSGSIVYWRSWVTRGFVEWGNMKILRNAKKLVRRLHVIWRMAVLWWLTWLVMVMCNIIFIKIWKSECHFQRSNSGNAVSRRKESDEEELMINLLKSHVGRTEYKWKMGMLWKYYRRSLSLG